MTAKIALSDLTDLARRAFERAGTRSAMASAMEGVEIPQGLLGELRALAAQDPRR